jgi:hypothetical protein
MTGDDYGNTRDFLENFHHWVPFAALFARQAVPENRPMTTRLIEQAFVAVIAGGGSAYGVNTAIDAKHEAEIQALQIQVSASNEALQHQLERSEARLTAQIMELRARQLK